jgi:hypothetical protein
MLHYCDTDDLEDGEEKIARLTVQPPIIMGQMRAYQLEGLNWMATLFQRYHFIRLSLHLILIIIPLNTNVVACVVVYWPTKWVLVKHYNQYRCLHIGNNSKRSTVHTW